MFTLFNARFIYENKLPSTQPESHDDEPEKKIRVTSFLGDDPDERIDQSEIELSDALKNADAKLSKAFQTVLKDKIIKTIEAYTLKADLLKSDQEKSQRFLDTVKRQLLDVKSGRISSDQAPNLRRQSETLQIIMDRRDANIRLLNIKIEQFNDMILSLEKGEKPRFDRAETFLE